MLAPFVGWAKRELDEELNILRGRLDKLEREGRAYFEMVPLEEADVAVLVIRYPRSAPLTQGARGHQ